jgi:hypothetical protein
MQPTDNSWSVHIFTLRGTDDRSGHPGYADMDSLEGISRDEAIYLPVAGISRLNMAPYTAALIHLSLEKLKNPEIPGLVLQTR